MNRIQGFEGSRIRGFKGRGILDQVSWIGEQEQGERDKVKRKKPETTNQEPEIDFISYT